MRALALSDAHLARIAQGLHEIAGWLGRSETTLGAVAPLLYTQGSVALRTSITPKRWGGFDADLVCELGEPAAWIAYPQTAFETVGRRLREMPGFRGDVRPKKRCWALIHDREFHVDVTPAIRAAPDGGSGILVFDGELGTWKPSDPLAFSGWFCDRAGLGGPSTSRIEPLTDAEWRASYARETPLAAAVQLLKRRRDVAFGPGEPEPSSIVLTTLAGRHYAGERSIAQTLGGILRNVAEAVADDIGALRCLRNPVLREEVLSECWRETADAFDAFRGFITDFVRRFDMVAAAPNEEAMTNALDELFGPIASSPPGATER